MTNKLLTLAGTLALLAVLGKFYAKPLLAQVATLVRDVDNPARHPYTQFPASQSCNSSFCFFDFPTVPPGKRLVVQQVNLMVRPVSGSTIVDQAELIAGLEPPNQFGEGVTFHFPMTEIALAGVGVVGSNTFVGNLAVVAYYDAGSYPHVETVNRTAGSANDFTQAVISGYLVNLP
jgi:hypothetical protein